MYLWLDTQKTLIGGGTAYFIYDDGHIIPRNDLLIVSSLPLIKKEEGNGESGAEYFLFDDFVQKNNKVRRYKQKTDFGDLHPPLHFPTVIT